MRNLIRGIILSLAVLAVLGFATPTQAQVIVPTIAYYPPAPVVTYSPTPVVAYSPPPVVSYYAPPVVAAPPVVTSFYAAPAPVTTYYTPGTVNVSSYRYGLLGLRRNTVVTYNPPAAVAVAPAPVAVPVISNYYMPPVVVTYP